MLYQPLSTEASPTLAAYAFAPKRLPKLDLEVDYQSYDHPALGTPKRPRLESDVDGDSTSNLRVKKRRLRRDLVTSRLSRPYATPTTYISRKGTRGLIHFGRTSGSTRNLLQKVALLNWTRERSRKFGVKRGRFAQDIWTQGSANAGSERLEASTAQDLHVARLAPICATPSTLGLSNYDALDLEGDPWADDPWVDCEEETLNSNFNNCELVEPAPKQLDAPRDASVSSMVFSAAFSGDGSDTGRLDTCGKQSMADLAHSKRSRSPLCV